MSLKSRLRLSILALVVTIVLALLALNLHSTVQETFVDARERTMLVAEQLKVLVMERTNELAGRAEEKPASLNENKELWYRIIRTDPLLQRILERTRINAGLVARISVLDDDGRALAVTPREEEKAPVRQLPASSLRTGQGLWRMLWEVFRVEQHYVVESGLGVPEQRAPVLSIRVFVSSHQLRDAIWPQLRSLIVVCLVSLLVSVALAYLVSNLVSGSLERITRHIEHIAAGEVVREEPPFESREFADLQKKLSLLARQYHGVREDVVNLRSNMDQMVEKLEEAVLLFDPDGRLMMAGPPAERLLTRNRKDMLGKSFEDIFPSWTALGGAIQEAVHHRRPIRDHQVPLDRPNMPQVRLLVTVELVDQYPEKRVGTLITLRDAETRRQLETHLDLANRLAAITRITSGVAHEMKNPLNAISVHLELARAKLAEHEAVRSAVQGVDGDLEIASQEVARLDRVVKSFVEFNRPLEPKMRACDLSALTREVAESIRPQCVSRSVEVNYAADIESAPIQADPDLLREAILNVALNGMEAMTSAGNLWLKTHQSSDDYVITVTDEGSGIPAEIQDKVYNLYFTTKKTGAGIGLSVTFRVVQVHNGAIQFESEVGKGTSFHIRFPAAKAVLANTAS